MKFYIISAIINILLLFIPIAIPAIEKEKKENVEVIKVNLINEVIVNSEINENIQNINENNFKEKKETTENKKNEEKKELIIEKKENKIYEKQQKENLNLEKNNKSTKETVELSKNVEGVYNGNTNDKVVTNNNLVNSNNLNSSKNSNNINSSSNSNNSNSTKITGNNKNSGNVCREGIDYIVNYNPSLNYPIAAQRSGISGDIVVNVKFNFTQSGKVSIVSASGGNSIFQSEAKIAANKIKVTIKNSETLKCTITKPFRFKKV